MTNILLFFLVLVLLLIIVITIAHSRECAHVEGREQLSGVGFLLPPGVFWDSNPGH